MQAPTSRIHARAHDALASTHTGCCSRTHLKTLGSSAGDGANGTRCQVSKSFEVAKKMDWQKGAAAFFVSVSTTILSDDDGGDNDDDDDGGGDVPFPKSQS
jgi:hypothetical protein